MPNCKKGRKFRRKSVRNQTENRMISQEAENWTGKFENRTANWLENRTENKTIKNEAEKW